MAVKIAIIYYSATGSVHDLAGAVSEGVQSAGAEVRLRRVQELAPAEAIVSNPAWQAHYDATRSTVAEATLDDLVWADGLAFGTPTRFGNPSAQLKEFIDRTGHLWFEGKLADKTVTAFTSAVNTHGGQESTLLALYNVFYHWGCIVVPPGYTDESVFAAGGNPYGTGWPAGMDGRRPDDVVLAAARYQGKRLAEKTALLRPNSEA